MQSLEDASHLLVGGAAHSLVQLALLALQAHALDDVGARRQLTGDIALAPAQYEGAHALRQQLRAQRFAVLLDGFAPGARKAARVAQKTGHQKVELRPQLAQVIFERRAGQAQAMAGLQAAQCARAAGAGVLHHLRFVEDQQMKALRGQRIDVAPQQRIGGEHQIVLRHQRELRLALRTLQRQQA